MKRVALVLRVSTDRQAQNDEGSLKNQLQRLRQHIEYKSVTCGEQWAEAGLYELKGVSGKNSMRSREFERLFSDIRAGRVNTVLCTALDRICRSVKDFLWFFEFLNEYKAEFVCLKQNYDTTSAQGRLFVTMMMALAEFEREQTSERTSEATLARAERGLWNGGRLLGYDADPNKKGSLVPNPEEAAMVNRAFDTYLECGSIARTTEALNQRGYRTKSYLSRRGVYRPGDKFHISAVNYLLKNPAYVGKKEINKGRRNGKEYRLVDAVWPAIVSMEKFEAARRLMAENGRTNKNASKTIRHAFVLSRGVLHCGRCGTVMVGRSGTGRRGISYFYYVCLNKECSLRVAADEVEGAVLERIRSLASDGAILQRLTTEANARLQRGKPGLEKQKQGLLKSLEEVQRQADNLLDHWSSLEGQTGKDFVTEKLSRLAQRRTELEAGLAETDEALRRAQEQIVTARALKEALGRIHEVYGRLRPFEQRELMGMVLKRAEVNERQIVLDIYALNEPQTSALETEHRGDVVRLPPNWLTSLDQCRTFGGPT